MNVYHLYTFRTKDDLKNELKRHREAAILFSNTDVYNEIRYYTEMIATFSDWLFDIIQVKPVMLSGRGRVWGGGGGVGAPSPFFSNKCAFHCDTKGVVGRGRG